jgi:hypothetical protein
MLFIDKELREELGMAWAEVIKNYQPNDIDIWIKFFKK